MESSNRDAAARRGMRRICVFCGSNLGSEPRYVDAARSLGRSLAKRGIGVVYGGANRGLMGAVADAALAEGGEVIGVIPYGLKEMEVAHEGLSRLDVVDTLHERKARMMELADGFLALPGGHGTLEELFEVLTWLQLAIHSAPVAVLNQGGFYDHVLGHLDRAASEGFIRPAHRELLIARDSVDGVIDAMERWIVPERPRWATRVDP